MSTVKVSRDSSGNPILTVEGFPIGGGQPKGSNAVAKTITTDQELETEVGTFAGAGLPAATSTQQQVQQNELLGIQSGQLGVGPAPIAATTPLPVSPLPPGVPGIRPPPGSGDLITPTVPQAPAANVGQIAATAENIPKLQQLGGAQAAQLTPTGPYVDPANVQGQLSAGALATAQTEQLDPKATVQYQLGQLMSSLQSGGPMPPWASPAVRRVNAVMQQRGLGASSMAAAAITTALMESGVQIAAQDANKYAAIQLTNLNNKQQTALRNAATVAAMDTANLNARLKAEVTNAQAFLSIDLKNLDNQQKSDTLTYQGLLQGLFKDTAEENARQQFNAKNELQVEEFFAELGAQVETTNANRTLSMQQFNVSEQNSMIQFAATMRDSRDKFNAQMQFAVDQSNAVWRREVNTANTALQNEDNRINVQNEYNANQNALNNLWQMYRDNASWNFQKSENALAREHDMGLNAMNFANSEALYNQQQKDSLASGIGNWLARWTANL